MRKVFSIMGVSHSGLIVVNCWKISVKGNLCSAYVKRS